MLTGARKVEESSCHDHVFVPAVLIGLFFLGFLICVLFLEKKKGVGHDYHTQAGKFGSL